MSDLHLLYVVGTRPNFLKIAPLFRRMAATGRVRQQILHTGQHYDPALSGQLFEDLELPAPVVDLGVGSGLHGLQTGKMMIGMEPVLRRLQPDWVVTMGASNSALAGSLVAAKLGISVARLDAGLRDGNGRESEDINQRLSDHLGSVLFTPEPTATENLRAEGVEDGRIFEVGNLGIDCMELVRSRAVELAVHRTLELTERGYVLVTLHRPGNVDVAARLTGILRALAEVVAECGVPVVFPLHPRTAANVRRFRAEQWLRNLHVLSALRYAEFQSLLQEAAVVITDSGGVQDETTVLGIPCVTLRPTTERRTSVERGTNVLFDGRLDDLADLVAERLREKRAPFRLPSWDGRSSERVAEVVLDRLAAVRPPLPSEPLMAASGSD